MRRILVASAEIIEVKVPSRILVDAHSTTIMWIKNYLLRERTFESLVGFRDGESTQFNIHSARGVVLEPSMTFADADIQPYSGLFVLRTDQNVSHLHGIADYLLDANDQLTENKINGQIRCIIYEAIKRSVRQCPGELIKMGVWVGGYVRRGLVIIETEKGTFLWRQKPFQEHGDFMVP